MNMLRTWRLSLPEESRTLQNAGQLLGISAAHLSRYESGVRRIPAERVQDIERITGIPRGELRPDIFGVVASEPPSLDCTSGAGTTGPASSSSRSPSEEAA